MQQPPPLRAPTAAPGAPPHVAAAGAEGPQHDALARPAPRPIPLRQKFPFVPLALTLLFLGFTLFPPVRGNPDLEWSFYGVAGALVVWQFVLWGVVRATGRALRIEWVPVKSHYVQACCQFTIMLYWGWFWRNVYTELPLIASQIVFFYALDALLSWSRGWTWRLGFGPLPIVISTNLFLWFRHDVYFLQFAMVATGALAKHFITWTRDGRRTHIFNPSAFCQSFFAIFLIWTGTSNSLTWGKEIAASFDPPYMLVVIFLTGLVVQYLFRVTLMTAVSTLTLVAIIILYHWWTGVHVFVNINIAGPVFLGMHLLMTDPATSPRTNMGKVLFGVLYALGYTVLFHLFDELDVPIFWDKMLPVPILNLCVPIIDRVMRQGILGRANRAWEGALTPSTMNLVHMGCWITLFAVMWGTGFINGPHPGSSITFWKQALAEGKPRAGHSLVRAVGTQAVAGESGAAWNELGLICMEGRIVEQNRAKAAEYFATACELRDECGCVNTVMQYLFLGEGRSEEDVAHALQMLEDDCNAGGSGRSCYLVGVAFETGRGRPKDPVRALMYFEKAGLDNIYAAKGAARVLLGGFPLPLDLRQVAATLVEHARRGDAESCWYLAYMYRDGVGPPPDEEKARSLLETACQLGLADACNALKEPTLPPYRNPPMLVPDWATAFPIDATEPAPPSNGQGPVPADATAKEQPTP